MAGLKECDIENIILFFCHVILGRFSLQLLNLILVAVLNITKINVEIYYILNEDREQMMYQVEYNRYLPTNSLFYEVY